MKYTEENYKEAKKDDIFEFICKKCGKKFTKTKREIQKNNNIPPKYCSGDCARTAPNLGLIEVTCLECDKKKIIKISEYNKSKNKHFFCNKSCAAKYNNRLFPKRTANINTNICPNCGNVKSKESALCRECEKNKRKNDFRNKQIGEYIGYGEKLKYLTTKCSTIRKDARCVLIENNIPCECEICYNKELEPILEVHHIKHITDFPPETKISEVNNIDNLMWLCPNHHRLVHLGLIQI